MKKSILLIATIVFSGFGIYAQTQNTAGGGEVSSDFLRPGVVITTMNFSGVSPIDLGAADKPQKFDNFAVSTDSGSLSFSYSDFDSDTYDKEVAAYVASISGQANAQFFYIENGQMNDENVLNRSKNSMTEAQRDVLKNLSGGLDDNAKSLLIEPLVENNYIMVVSPTNISTSTDDNGNTMYSSNVATSVYKVYIGEYEDENGVAIDATGQINQWYANYGSDFGKVAGSTFPVQKIFSSVSKVPAVGYDAAAVASINEANKGKIIAIPAVEFNTSVLNTAVKEASKGVEEFQTRAKVEEKMLIALGSKEGLKVDDRFFSYEKQKDPETRKMILVRKGIDRVKKVGNTDVDLVANPEAQVERTKLYGDGGKKTRTGYIAMEAPEFGVGISGFYRSNPGLRIDYRVGKFVGIPNLFIYVDAEFVQYAGDEDEPFIGTDPDTGLLVGLSGDLNGAIASVGLQKNFNLGRMFALAPFAQYAAYATVVDENGTDAEIPADYAAGGLRVIIKLGPSIQLMPEVTYMYSLGDAVEDLVGLDTNLPAAYEDDLYIGGALRFNF